MTILSDDAGQSLRPDPDQIRAMLNAITIPGEPFEIRIVKLRKQGPDGLIPNPYSNAESGFFTDVESAVAAVARFNGTNCAGVYVTLNALPDHVMNWGADRIAKGRATGDSDVTAYRHLYLDLDPVRPADTNATDAEREAARDRAKRVLAYLPDLGWPDPVWAGNSGSGSLMLFRIDLENTKDNADLVKRVLQGLSDLFSDGVVGIDTTVTNPARICRLAGTVNAKAITPKADRPWRRASGKANPDVGTVTVAQLEAVAAVKPEPSKAKAFKSATGDGASYDGPDYDLATILDDSGIQYREKRKDYGTVYEVDCQTSTDHTGGACFIQFGSGKFVYRCLHQSCSGKGWQDVKHLLKLPEGGTGPRVTFAGKQAGGNEPGDAGAAGDWETVPPDSEQRTRPTLHPAALHGLAGDVVRAAMESTEGDPVGILTFFLVAFGNAAGPSAFYNVGDDEHGTALFAVVVGDSAKDRKGHSRVTAMKLMKHADPEWYSRMAKGLSSGEGLIWAVRDPIEKTGKDGAIEIIDEGVKDKRLPVVEPEFGRVLSTKERSGNTLTAIMRDAWDRGQTLGALTKTPYKATGAHISIYGNITESDLRENMTGVDILNGFANRIAWFVVTRARVAARLPVMPEVVFDALVERIQSALRFARTVGEIDFTAEAWPLWEQAYARFAQRSSGLVESLTARGDPITLRLALIYALLDECDAIHPVHLKAALAVWSHAQASVQYLFGTLTGNPIADRILALLRDGIEMTQTDISNALGTHVKAASMASAIHHLKQTGRIVEERLRPAGGTGRTVTRYRLPMPTGTRKAA
ncbi:MAG: hypothetical protein ACR2OU_00565 [Thermomicrobiales bacterium]